MVCKDWICLSCYSAIYANYCIMAVERFFRIPMRSEALLDETNGYIHASEKNILTSEASNGFFYLQNYCCNIH